LLPPQLDKRKWPPLVVVGLTGGIASGKSTVSRIFAEAGATILDADQAGHQALGPGEPGLAEVIAAFGADHLQGDGALDRRRLGNHVFASPAARATLNRIAHPRIAGILRRKLYDLSGTPPNPPLVFIEAAVLVEAGWAALVDRIIVVTAQHSTQVARLIADRGFSPAQAEARIHSQLPFATRLRYADFRVDGEAPLAETRRQAADIWSALLQLAERAERGST